MASKYQMHDRHFSSPLRKAKSFPKWFEGTFGTTAKLPFISSVGFFILRIIDNDLLWENLLKGQILSVDIFQFNLVLQFTSLGEGIFQAIGGRKRHIFLEGGGDCLTPHYQ